MTTEWRYPTESELLRMEGEAYEYGASDNYYDPETGTVDWYGLIRAFEVGELDFGSDLRSPAVQRVKAAYRRGRSDSTRG